MPAGSIFLIATTAYFLGQVVLRLALGGALETDEAEMMVMTPGLQMGYGPQLPLYNWLQVGVFAVFGKTLFALSLLKNLLLWATYMLMFLGLRLWVPAGLAVIGALSLFLLPDVAWEAQRATTHSNMLLMTAAATFAAFLWVLKEKSWAAYLALGLAIGLGGLAKYNFWLVPIGLFAAALTMSEFRRAILSVRLMAALALAAMIVAGPYLWMLYNPELAFSSTRKLQIADEGLAAVRGLPKLVAGYVVLMILPLMVTGAIFLARRRAAGPGGPSFAIVPLLWRAAGLQTVLVVAGVVAADVGHITPRWLLPVVFLAVPALTLGIFTRLNGQGRRAYGVALAVLAVAIFVGLVFDRYKIGARRGMDFTPLLQAIDHMAPDTPVVAEFYTAGNLAYLAPDKRVAPYLAFAAPEFSGEKVLFILRGKVPDTLARGLRQAGWPDGYLPRVIDEETLMLAFGDSGTSDKRVRFRLYLVDTAELPG